MASSSAPESISIGRAADNRYPIFHPSVLDYHAKIMVKDDLIWLIEKSQGAKTQLKVGNDWVFFYKGPLNLDDQLRFGKAEPVTVAMIFEALKLNLRTCEIKRRCVVCQCSDEPEKIQKCKKCLGVYVAEPSEFISPEKNGAKPEGALPPGTVRLIRCLGCATIFLFDAGVCPECGLKLVSYKV